MELEAFIIGLELAKTKGYVSQSEAKAYANRYIEANLKSLELSTEE